MTKEIQLTKGLVAIVDDDDFESLTRYSWCLNGGYPARGYNENGKVKVEKMHHAIVGKVDGLVVDHINGNRLDNRRCNLRHVTVQQNTFNTGKRRINGKGTKPRSRFKGVTWRVERKFWVSHIALNGKKRYLGSFKSEIDAARAYNKAAIKYYGAHARLNEI